MDGRFTPGFNHVLEYRTPNTVVSPDNIPPEVPRVHIASPEETVNETETIISWLTESSREVSPTRPSLESAQPQMSVSPEVDLQRGPFVENQEHKSINAPPETPNIRANSAKIR